MVRSLELASVSLRIPEMIFQKFCWVATQPTLVRSLELASASLRIPRNDSPEVFVGSRPNLPLTYSVFVFVFQWDRLIYSYQSVISENPRLLQGFLGYQIFLLSYRRGDLIPGRRILPQVL